MSNKDKQHTLKSKVKISGIGLHTGNKVNITLQPAETYFGYQFKRTDVSNDNCIKADCDLVSNTSRGTTITQNNISISTMEHLLAALTACQIDNCLIEIDAQEVPIFNGSSYPFIAEIDKVEIVEQEAEKKWHTITETIFLQDTEKNVDMILMPADEYQILSIIDFNSNVLGVQTAQMKNINEFKNDFSKARTFCFLHEIEFLLKNNLIKGGDLDNAIVIVNDVLSPEQTEKLSALFNKKDITVNKGYLNNLTLRYDNEPARHKLLDIVGDLALSGYHIKAKIIAVRPGHKTNIAFAKKIKNYIEKK